MQLLNKLKKIYALINHFYAYHHVLLQTESAQIISHNLIYFTNTVISMGFIVAFCIHRKDYKMDF